jgi:hypothetical protein
MELRARASLGHTHTTPYPTATRRQDHLRSIGVVHILRRRHHLITTRERGSMSNREQRNGDQGIPGGSANFEINPMDHSRATRLQNLRQAPRCGARTRGGTPCQRPAIRGRKRCRLHGGLSPGAPRGEKNGNFKTGDWTLDAIEERKWLRSLVSFCKGSK